MSEMYTSSSLKNDKHLSDSLAILYRSVCNQSKCNDKLPNT